MPSKRKLIPPDFDSKVQPVLNFSVDCIVPLRSRKTNITLCTDKSHWWLDSQKLKSWNTSFIFQSLFSTSWWLWFLGSTWISLAEAGILETLVHGGFTNMALQNLTVTPCKTLLRSFYHASDKCPWRAPLSFNIILFLANPSLIWQRQALAGSSILLELLSLYLFWQILLFMSRDIGCFSIYLK